MPVAGETLSAQVLDLREMVVSCVQQDLICVEWLCLLVWVAVWLLLAAAALQAVWAVCAVWVVQAIERMCERKVVVLVSAVQAV